jgi:hypothetical protein
MSAFLKFKPSLSADVVGYRLFYKNHDPAEPITKNNAFGTIELGNPPSNAQDEIHIELNAIPSLANLDGDYDFGIAAIDDAGNVSPLLTQGLINIGLDFLAPNPPSEASVYWN